MLYLHPLVLGFAAMGLVAQLAGEPVEKQPAPPAQILDPNGWRDFRWDMTKQQAGTFGAKIFLDNQDEEQFRLADVEILPGKNHFRVDLQFFSHFGLTSILVKMKPREFHNPW